MGTNQVFCWNVRKWWSSNTIKSNCDDQNLVLHRAPHIFLIHYQLHKDELLPNFHMNIQRMTRTITLHGAIHHLKQTSDPPTNHFPSARIVLSSNRSFITRHNVQGTRGFKLYDIALHQTSCTSWYSTSLRLWLWTQFEHPWLSGHRADNRFVAKRRVPHRGLLQLTWLRVTRTGLSIFNTRFLGFCESSQLAWWGW